MSFEIIWTPRALVTFNGNIEYLVNEWDQNVLDDFLERTHAILDLIKDDPEIFSVDKSNKAIRKTIVTKQITLYYKIVNKSKIDLITFWNVYQNPKKLKLK